MHHTQPLGSSNSTCSAHVYRPPHLATSVTSSQAAWSAWVLLPAATPSMLVAASSGAPPASGSVVGARRSRTSGHGPSMLWQMLDTAAAMLAARAVLHHTSTREATLHTATADC
jgi:hypothetical protein